MTQALLKYAHVWENNPEIDFSIISRGANYDEAFNVIASCCANLSIPTKYKSFYYPLLATITHPLRLYSFIDGLHKEIDESVLSEEEVQIICQVIAKPRKGVVGEYHYQALKKIYASALFTHPQMRHELINEILSSAIPKAVVDGLQALKNRDLLGEPNIVNAVIHAKKPQQLVDSIAQLRLHPEITQQIESLFEKYPLKGLNQDEFDMLKNMLPHVIKIGDSYQQCSFTSNQLNQLVVSLYPSLELYNKIGRRYLYWDLMNTSSRTDKVNVINLLIELAKMGILLPEIIHEFCFYLNSQGKK